MPAITYLAVICVLLRVVVSFSEFGRVVPGSVFGVVSAFVEATLMHVLWVYAVYVVFDDFIHFLDLLDTSLCDLARIPSLGRTAGQHEPAQSPPLPG